MNTNSCPKTFNKNSHWVHILFRNLTARLRGKCKNTKRIRSSRLGLQQEARNFFAAGFNTTMRNLQCIHIGDRMVIVHLPTTLRDVPIYGLL